MGMSWTEEQQKVIELRNRNILVSAAAGSGKTAVLVERIIRRIMDPETPVDADRLLIVTFTEAAASEMKERISDAIEQKMDEHPGDARLEQQATLINSAPITTIHSFCLSVIREHFHVIGIDPGFRIAEEGELKLLKQDVLEELLESCYKQGKQEFLEFVERFGTGKDDKKTETLILKLYEYSRSYPQPEKWLESCADAYDSGRDGFAGLMRTAEKRIHYAAENIRKLLQRGLDICGQPDGPYMYGDMLESDIEQAEAIINAGNYSDMYRAVESFSWKRLSSRKDDSVSEGKKESVRKIRDLAKKNIAELRDTYLYAPYEQWSRNMESAAGSMRTLADLVEQFSELFSEKKRLRNIIDFSDMEQFALAVLTEEKNGELVPSAVAAEYQDRFEEVMIDEYQDSNLVQEAILTSVSRMSEGQNNIFMVGDVKQSIYSFRLSRPALFLEKYDAYTLEDSCCQRVDLHKNFRSRKEVLDCVNYIFCSIMSKESGGVEYDSRSRLYPGAEFPSVSEENKSSFCAELLLLDKNNPGDDDERRGEARMIAARINELVGCGEIFDKESGGFRKIEYRDIVILTRSIKGWAEVFASVLAEEGIPAYSVSREGYFETYEVSILLDYLSILDNARQDIPLAAVLTSPFCGLTAADMAQIRAQYPNTYFYEAAVLYMRAGENREIRSRLSAFYSRTESFRKRIPYTPIHELLTDIIETTGYDLYITAMPGGARRMANVEMLTEKASAFEGTSYKGLFNFVRYIEQLKKYDVDYGEAGILDEQSDTVRIMSIHKSKGLEFPVVFAAGLGKQFNLQDAKAQVVIHPELGVGLDDIDLNRRTKTQTFLKRLIREYTVSETLSEEMRILYVALTRAKEKLIMTGTADLTDIESDDHIISAGDAGKARTYLDWILPVLTDSIHHGNMEIPVKIRCFSGANIMRRAAEEAADYLTLDVLKNWDKTRQLPQEFSRMLREQIEYVYPFEKTGKMKLKFTVSELKKRLADPEEEGEPLYPDPEVIPIIPQFMVREKALSGASRGSAYHKLLELLDFREKYEVESIRDCVKKFTETGRITGEMADCINEKDICRFLKCRTAARMSEAAVQGKLFKEQPFVISMDAEKIYPGEESGEKILVQGIIDVYFEEKEELIVLDYKTDRVNSAQELTDKYRIQLDYYAQALEQLTGRKVKEKIIYSFALGKEIYV